LALLDKRILKKTVSKKIKTSTLAGKVEALIQATDLGKQIPSSSFKAELERRGAGVLARLGFPEHTPFIEFRPALFTLQRHWWGAKSHWDFRILEEGSPLWFGFETFSDPFLVTKDRPAKAQAKGLMAFFLSAAGLEKKFERKGAPRGENVPEGVVREMAWLWMEGKINPGDTGNPTKDKPGGIVILEKLQSAVIHRRSYDTIDITFLGNRIFGRYILRLIEDPILGFRFSFRRLAEQNQFPSLEMRRAATVGWRWGKLTAPAGLAEFRMKHLESKAIRISHPVFSPEVLRHR